MGHVGGITPESIAAGFREQGSDCSATRGAPSDYGRAFHRLLRSSDLSHGRRSVLVVLGDGRTHRFDPLGWCFEEIAQRCGAVLWLVPESPALWQSGDSALDHYLPWVDAAVEVSDLAGLARGVGELLRRLG